jgi:hypothetical protein
MGVPYPGGGGADEEVALKGGERVVGVGVVGVGPSCKKRVMEPWLWGDIGGLGDVVASSGRVGDARLWRVVHNHGDGSSRVDVDDDVELSCRQHLDKQKCEGR